MSTLSNALLNKFEMMYSPYNKNTNNKWPPFPLQNPFIMQFHSSALLFFGLSGADLGQLGTPTVLVNCAVTITTGAKLIDMPIDAIQREIGTNILGNFYTIKEFLPDMLRLERGHIVTISSALGFMGPARLSISRPQTFPFPQFVFAYDVLFSSSLFLRFSLFFYFHFVLLFDWRLTMRRLLHLQSRPPLSPRKPNRGTHPLLSRKNNPRHGRTNVHPPFLRRAHP